MDSLRIGSTSPPARVLVVDDDAPTVRMIQFLLLDEGFVVSCAPDGETAISRYQQEQPDLMLLNVQMPGENGFDLLDRFRCLGYEGPVVLITARPDVPGMLELGQVQVDGCMIKPLHPDEVVLLVRHLLEDVVRHRAG